MILQTNNEYLPSGHPNAIYTRGKVKYERGFCLRSMVESIDIKAIRELSGSSTENSLAANNHLGSTGYARDHSIKQKSALSIV